MLEDMKGLVRSLVDWRVSDPSDRRCRMKERVCLPALNVRWLEGGDVDGWRD